MVVVLLLTSSRKKVSNSRGLAVQFAGRFIGKDQLSAIARARAIATRCCCPPDIS